MDHSAPNPPTHRRSIRLRGHDYASAGTYYVTICTQARRCLFGHIENGSMIRNTYGDVVAEGWEWLATHFEGIDFDAWIVMPNHLHGIIIRQKTSSGASQGAHTIRLKPLGGLIGAFKTVTTKRINQLRQTPGVKVWQRNYWEHIIRDSVEMDSIRFYIAKNVVNWPIDDLNTTR
jgi:putative transposase